MKPDLFSGGTPLLGLTPTDFGTDIEGPLIDATGFNGVALAILIVQEDDSQANTEKLDVGVHNVLDDSEAPVSGNQVATFTQIVGANDTGIAPIILTALVNLELLDPAKPNLQFDFVETNTYECIVSAVIIMPGDRYET